jgi:hypothetical protein
VQKLQFITFQNHTEMRNRHNRKLAHTHSVKENSRKNRFKSRQKLQNFKVFTGDPSQRRDSRQERQGGDKNSTASSTSPSRLLAKSSMNDFSENNPKSSSRNETIRLRSVHSPTSLLDANRGDPCEILPINSARVDYLMDSRQFVHLLVCRQVS